MGHHGVFVAPDGGAPPDPPEGAAGAEPPDGAEPAPGVLISTFVLLVVVLWSPPPNTNQAMTPRRMITTIAHAQPAPPPEFELGVCWICTSAISFPLSGWVSGGLSHARAVPRRGRLAC
jgi:hypothetical protein